MLQAVLSILGTRLSTRVTTLAAGVLIARTIGVDSQGALGLLLMLGGLMVGLVDLGLAMGAVYFVGRQDWSEERYTGLALPVLTMSIVTGLLVFALLASFWLTDYVVVLSGPNLFALSLYVSAHAFSEVYLNLTLARQRLRDYNLSEIISAVAVVLVTLALVLRGVRNPAAYFTMYGGTRLLVCAYLVIRLGRLPRLHSIQELPRLLRYCLSQWSANLFSQLSVRVDAFMLAWFIPHSKAVSLADLGLYSICLLTITRLMEIQRSIQTAFFSRMAGLGEKDAIATTNATYRKSFLVYLLLSVALITFGYPVLWIYGPEYPAAWGVLSVLVLGTIALRGNAGVLMLYFSTTDQSRYTVHTHQISLVGNFLLSLFLIPRLGIMGAALGTSISFAAGKLYLLWRYQEVTGSRWARDLLIRPAEAREALVELRRGLSGLMRGARP